MTKKDYLFKVAWHVHELLGEKVKKIEVSHKGGENIETYAYTVYLNMGSNEQDSIREELNALAEEKSKAERLQILFILRRYEIYRVMKFMKRPPLVGKPIIDVSFPEY